MKLSNFNQLISGQEVSVWKPSSAIMNCDTLMHCPISQLGSCTAYWVTRLVNGETLRFLEWNVGTNKSQPKQCIVSVNKFNKLKTVQCVCFICHGDVRVYKLFSAFRSLY